MLSELWRSHDNWALQEGCSYCGTHFHITELFPKVVDFWYVPDNIRQSSMKRNAVLFSLLGTILGLCLFAAGGAKNGISGMSLLVHTLFGGVLFTFFGYAAFASLKIGKMLFGAVSSTPMLVKQQEARKKITTLLAGFDSGFSWTYFINRLVPNLKIVLFAENQSNLVMYQGKEIHPEFADILDASFNGGVRLDSYQVQDGYCTLNLDLELDCVHKKGEQIYKKKEVFALCIMKNITRMEEFGFSVKKVKCPCCGGSFDATRERHCAYCCGEPYDMREDGWTIMELRMR